jgi:hypothetical protein
MRTRERLGCSLRASIGAGCVDYVHVDDRSSVRLEERWARWKMAAKRKMGCRAATRARDGHGRGNDGFSTARAVSKRPVE